MGGIAKAPAIFPASSTDWNDDVREAQQARYTAAFLNNSAAAISDGDLVALDLSTAAYLGTAIKKSTTTADDPIVVGVADQDIPIGKRGSVVVYGFKADVRCLAGVAAGDSLQAGTTAASVAKAGATTERSIGVAMTAVSGGYCDMFVRCMN